MKITNAGDIDSGAGTAGYKAYKRGLNWCEAEKLWATYKKNSLWFKAAFQEYRKAGGYVPDEKTIYRRKKIEIFKANLVVENPVVENTDPPSLAKQLLDLEIADKCRRARNRNSKYTKPYPWSK